MTSPSNTLPRHRPRRSRGGRGRGGGRPAPAGTRTRPTQTPRDVVRARPSSVPVGADATVLPTDTTFAALGVPAPLVEVLTASGITAPFPIQVATLPDTPRRPRRARPRPHRLAARRYAFACRWSPASPPSDSRAPAQAPARADPGADPRAGQPGRRRRRRRWPRALGMQHDDDLRRRRPEPAGRRRSRGGVDVVIACPGRLEDLIGQGHCDLGAVEVTVLDEADHMADLGFLPGVKRLLDTHPEGRPADAVLGHAGQRRRRPGQALPDQPGHALRSTRRSRAGLDDDPPRVPRRRRRQGRGRPELRLPAPGPHACCSPAPSTAPRSWPSSSTAAGVPAVDLHGNLQPERPRAQPRGVHRRHAPGCWCATDIAARGIHVDDVALVVHVDPPAEHKAYLHRSGRTARAGAEGTVVTIATPDQAGEVRTLTRQAGITPEVSAIKPGAREITALTGPAAPYVEPAPVVEQPQGNGGGRPSPRRLRPRLLRRRGLLGGRSSSGGAAKSGGPGRASGPARTRAELAARAGSSSAASFSARSRRGR